MEVTLNHTLQYKNGLINEARNFLILRILILAQWKRRNRRNLRNNLNLLKALILNIKITVVIYDDLLGIWHNEMDLKLRMIKLYIPT